MAIFNSHVKLPEGTKQGLPRAFIVDQWPCKIFPMCGSSYVDHSIGESQVIVAVSGFAVGGDAMASAKVDSNVLIGLQGCKDQHLWHLVKRWGNRKSGGKFLFETHGRSNSNSNGWSGRCDA